MRILVLDDDPGFRRQLSTFLGLNGHEPLETDNLAAARALLAGLGSRPEVILADLYLGEERGTAILEAAGRIPVVMISGAGGLREAVDAMKAGAWDFLEKPLDPDRLLGLLRNLDRGISAERGMAALREAWLGEHAAYAAGSPFEAALAEAARVAPSPLSVLVQGPSGSGKEVIARWVHYCSPRSGGPFIAVNCAAVPPELAESLFFGARRGSYTGAESDRAGWFQAARDGTLFLDELGEIPLPVQAKLLRAVETGEVQRLGATGTERVSVRVVSATNRDLEAEAAAGRFRTDLFWRLAQATIRVPPLAERPADIPHLARWFLARAMGASFGPSALVASGKDAAEGPPGPSGALRFDEGALAWLEGRDWPGNVRELRDLVERAIWLRDPSRTGPWIGAAYLADLESTGARRSAKTPAHLEVATAEAGASRLETLRKAKLDFEKAYILRALAENGGSVAKAAAALDLLPNNLSRRMGELGIRTGKN
jgi:two-component system NtrC family response regulator